MLCFSSTLTYTVLLSASSSIISEGTKQLLLSKSVPFEVQLYWSINTLYIHAVHIQCIGSLHATHIPTYYVHVYMDVCMPIHILYTHIFFQFVCGCPVSMCVVRGRGTNVKSHGERFSAELSSGVWEKSILTNFHIWMYSIRNTTVNLQNDINTSKTQKISDPLNLVLIPLP